MSAQKDFWGSNARMGDEYHHSDIRRVTFERSVELQRYCTVAEDIKWLELLKTMLLTQPDYTLTIERRPY